MSESTNNELKVCYLGVGSNLGNKLLNVKNAIAGLNDIPQTKLLARSSFYRSEPWGYKHQDWFVNAVVSILTSLTPVQLLSATKSLERHLGCKPKSHRWGPRLIDIDILLYGNEIIDTPELKIPHPFLTARLFFLVPLLQIAPAITLPLSNEPLQKFVSLLKDEPQPVILED
ncbi:MAG: 2-amino-4-hydroxy-6-hydroxymethyldihydropteridine diphosphokinase [Candidatus Sumerlaeia bacterium]|nr:2-amino-4-hydroxy-6-hydroxymethyldihydropteridine diphosphokinase [Candidatus Sumerlaeia bacterium]